MYLLQKLVTSQVWIERYTCNASNDNFLSRMSLSTIFLHVVLVLCYQNIVFATGGRTVSFCGKFSPLVSDAKIYLSIIWWTVI